MKKGFGIIEVLAAAVVLGFLLVGLNTLQLGNRESILRIRARDGASDIAQEVIDSIRGSASIASDITRSCDDGAEDLCRSRTFKNATVDYKVEVNVTPDDKLVSEIKETEYVNNPPNDIKIQHQFGKRVDVTVSWLHKKSRQSINVSTVVR